MVTKDTIICSFKLFFRVQSRFPRKDVYPVAECENDFYYYFNRSKKIRRVDANDGSIWVNDHDRGFPYQKKIRVVRRLIV